MRRDDSPRLERCLGCLQADLSNSPLPRTLAKANKGALPPCISPGIFRFRAGAGWATMRSGQPEDRAMQGCNPSAALEAGAGGFLSGLFTVALAFYFALGAA